MKVNFVGWYGRRNLGDIALKEAICKLSPDSKNVFTEQAIEGADKYVLGGGDVIKSYYLDSLKGKEFCILGAGLGYDSEIELLKEHKVRKAYFRNPHDVELALGAGIDAYECPDLAFALDQVVIEERHASEKKRAVVILSDAINPSCGRQKPAESHYAEYFKWELAGALSYLNEWYDFSFVPFSAEKNDSDIRCAMDVKARMNRLTEYGDKMLEPPCLDASLYAIAKSDLVISMKFHGLIFALLCNTPFVNIGWTKKTETLCKDWRCESASVSPFTFTTERFLKAVKAAEQRKFPWHQCKVIDAKRELEEIDLL